jgi:hypothetical protein
VSGFASWALIAPQAKAAIKSNTVSLPAIESPFFELDIPLLPIYEFTYHY